MVHAGEILGKFYAAVVKRDFATARTYLADDLVFVGLFQTYRRADEYVAALTGLMQIRGTTSCMRFPCASLMNSHE